MQRPSTPLHLYTSKKGSVLLLALLIMSSVVITSAGLASLILNSLQQTRMIDNSMIAYYAAESGIEDAIYRARRLDELPLSLADQPLTVNTAKWSRTVTTMEPIIYATIPENSLLEVALFDPDNETTSLNIRAVKVSWTSACPDEPCPVLDASLVGWQPQNPIIWNPNAASFKFTSSPAVLSVDTINQLYKLRLRAEKDIMRDVRIQAYTDDGLTSATNLPGRLRVASTGEYGGTRQRVVVSVPRRTPLSSIYDFVIFSECSIVKGGGGISCP